MKYTVHVGDGLLRAQETLRATCDTRAAAQAEAKRLIREEGCRATEVRCERRLFDAFVRRGERTPHAVYSHQQRVRQATLEEASS